MSRAASRRRLWALRVVVVLGAASLAACGSHVAPETHRDANAPGSLSAARGSASGDDSGLGGTSGAAGAGGLPGSGGNGGTVSPSDDPRRAERPTTPEAPPAPCDGFHNQAGVTDTTITIANVADISGPVPGVFESARQATRAYVAYFNATHPAGICGRKLKLIELDSRTDASADQQAYQKACEQAFAAVGSMAAFDFGGAGVAEQCGLPDLRSSAVNPERVACTTCFSAQGIRINEVANAMPRFFAERFPEASQHAGFVWVDAHASRINAQNFIKAWEKNGFTFVYTAGIDVSEFNYTPYVQRMQDMGVRYVQFLGPYQFTVRLARAMQQQGYKPEVFVQDSTIYNQDFVDLADGVADDIWVYLNISPFSNTQNAEMETYLEWLHQVAPNASPTFFGVFAWSAAKLFTDRAQALGGNLTRSSLVASLRTVDDWTGGGIHAPQHVGAESTGECWRMFQLHGEDWANESGPKYRCEGLTVN